MCHLIFLEGRCNISINYAHKLHSDVTLLARFICMFVLLTIVNTACFQVRRVLENITAAAAIANSVMQDLGLITDDDKTYVIDRSKLRRERERCRAEIRKKEQENFKL